MKKTFFSVFIVVFLCFGSVSRSDAAEKNAETRVSAQIEAVFGKECEKLLVQAIDEAQKEIQVAIYSITRHSIRDALVNATERGVKVDVKYDEKSAEWKGMSAAIAHMKKRGVKCIPVKMNKEYAKMHHKFTVIDEKRVLTGSYNYSTSASMVSYENLVLIESAKIAEKFAEEFEQIKNK
ncbi:phospholipase D-like domain-containing protein [Verrucomicrobiota bacterium]